MDDLLDKSQKFYNRLLNFLYLNQALVLTGLSTKFIHEMDEVEYEEYLISLEYLNHHGLIDLDQLDN